MCYWKISYCPIYYKLNRHIIIKPLLVIKIDFFIYIKCIMEN